MLKIAIIKSGDFETFHEGDQGLGVSLGDVLRTTPILSLFPGFEIHWFTSPCAQKLLARVPGLHQIHTQLREFDFSGFELVMNLERTADALAAMESVAEHRRVGFVGTSTPLLRVLGRAWTIEGWKKALCAQGKHYWQQWLFALLQKEWLGESYHFSDPRVSETSDLGLNWKVGMKWPGKTLPFPHWQRLAEALAQTKTVSWQQGFDDLDQYIRWISSCRAIVTHDSLGMHLGIAMRKKVIVFFSQPNESEVYLYDLGKKIFFGPSGLSEQLCRTAGE